MSKQNKREAVMNSALRLLCEEGFQQTSTARISREAGVGTGTLFNYFSSKDDLIIALFVESKTEMEEKILPKVLDKTEDKVEQIKLLWNESIKWSLQNPLKHRFIKLFKASPYYKHLKEDEQISGAAYKMHEMFKDMLALKSSKLPDELVAHLFLSLHTSLVDYLSQIPKNKHNELIEETFNMFLLGLES